MRAKRRLADPTVLVLASLAEGPKHGYGIQQDVRRFAGVSLGPGTVYGVIGRLEQDGMIEPVEALDGDDRRRPYRLTRAGLDMAEEHLRLMADAAGTGLNRLAVQQ